MSRIVGLVFEEEKPIKEKTIKEMKKEELIAFAKEKEIEIDPNAKVDEIRLVLEALRDN